jgi:calcineurin-like phosphoesterase family protein
VSNIYFWSDTHFAHPFVAGLRGFQTDAEHDEHLQAVWRRTVRSEDRVWLLGDISGGRGEEEALDILATLPGRKNLIAGNHDSVAGIHRNAWKRYKRFLEVFDSVQDFTRMKVGGVPFLLSHYPYTGDHADRADRYATYRLHDTGVPLVHGHIHDTRREGVTGKGTPMLNVGVEVAPRPVSINEIRDWLKEAGA